MFNLVFVDLSIYLHAILINLLTVLITSDSFDQLCNIST